MNIRTATIEDLNILSAVEKECFPANEAATEDAFRERLKYYPDHFIPEYRNNGCAGRLIRHVISEADKQARDGVVLTCKKELVPYYSRFGFVSEGVTLKSLHGGVTWYQMRLTFKAV